LLKTEDEKTRYCLDRIVRIEDQGVHDEGQEKVAIDAAMRASRASLRAGMHAA
jgi:hypothetical protein